MSNLTINITENGTTTLATSGKYCDRNVDVVVDVASSGGGAEVEPIVLSGDCSYTCAGVLGSKYVELFGDTISTEALKDIGNMFYRYENETIPFELNGEAYTDCENLFLYSKLKEVPKMNDFTPNNLRNLFQNCWYLREIPYSAFNNWDLSYLCTQKSTGADGMFYNCYSLRSYPNELLQALKTQTCTYTYTFYKNLFNRCYVLEEILDLPINTTTTYNATSTSSILFYDTIEYCGRLKRFTFETNEDGSAIVTPWANQILDFTVNTGWTYTISQVIDYNSGITADKQVSDDASYQALKDDADWFAMNVEYSRYNHDSAVETINSLPNTTAAVNSYSGKANTIKFKGDAGSATDGGAINTLTSSEIAVASNKGWTVTLS